MKNLSIIIALSLVTLFACTTKQEPPVMPYQIGYTITSNDTGAQALVHTYFGDRMNYFVFDTEQVVMRREALIGSLTQWYDGENLYIREEQGDYCSCVHLNGQLLDFWREDEWIQEFSYSDDTFEMLGLQAYAGLATDEMGDSTWIVMTNDLPNAWFESPTFKGLPLEYSYKLREGKVFYTVDTLEHFEGSFDQSGYDTKCVKIPARAYLGFAPNDTVVEASSHVWVYGNLIDEMNNFLMGEVRVETLEKGVATEAKLYLDKGTYDLQLEKGGHYILDFSAPGMVHKRIEFDLRNVPKSEGDYIAEMEIALFSPMNQEVENYLQSNVLGIATYDEINENITFDFEYTQAVSAEVERLRDVN